MGGYQVPSGVKVSFVSCTVQQDPKVADEPEAFIPERWLPEAVAARKGTPKEVLDNKVIAKPFGFGPRMCLGARFAELELKAFLTRFVRDWSFEETPKNQAYKIRMATGLKADPYPKLTFTKTK